MTEGQMPHALALTERRKLTMTGALEVVSFDETTVVVKTTLGTLVIQGQNLQLKQLTLDGGNVAVEGEIGSLQYEHDRPAGGWLSRLLG